jgi:hypothetical protein
MTRGHGGLGLGLAIARHLVELQGGRIFVASDGPGTGTTSDRTAEPTRRSWRHKWRWTPDTIPGRRPPSVHNSTAFASSPSTMTAMHSRSFGRFSKQLARRVAPTAAARAPRFARSSRAGGRSRIDSPRTVERSWSRAAIRASCHTGDPGGSAHRLRAIRGSEQSVGRWLPAALGQADRSRRVDGSGGLACRISRKRIWRDPIAAWIRRQIARSLPNSCHALPLATLEPRSRTERPWHRICSVSS